eukprot:EG_transcript_2675
MYAVGNDVTGYGVLGSNNRWHRKLRFRVTYFRIHLLYFILIGLAGAVVMFLVEKSNTSFLDCLFMTYSASSLTGLESIDIAQLHFGSLWVLLVMMTLGNQVLMSSAPILIREFYFRRAFRAAKAANKEILKNNVEFRALQSIRRISLGIYTMVILLSFTILAPWLTYAQADIFRERQVDPVWFAWFLVNSAWCNCGFTPFYDNLVMFRTDHMVLLVTSLLILLGNTTYPVLLRFVVYCLHRLYPKYTPYKFLLQYPRRCCTHLFQGIHTKVLLLFVAVFTIVQYATIMGFQFNDSFADMPPVARSLCSWFQAVSTRTGGFNAVDMALLAPAIQLIQAILMYVSSYPLISGLGAISEEKRQNVVMEEFTKDETFAEQTLEVKSKSKSYAKEVKGKCMADLWLLALALFIITATEGNHIKEGKFSIFTLIFEICSAYGTVGLSLGYPGMVTSLSGSFNPISKLMMIAVMLAGRHRGLPRSIDRAVNLNTMSGDAEIAADPEVAEFLQAVAQACTAVEEQRKAAPYRPTPAAPPKPDDVAVKVISLKTDYTNSCEPAANGSSSGEPASPTDCPAKRPPPANPLWASIEKYCNIQKSRGVVVESELLHDPGKPRRRQRSF